jgi:GTP 3',8-cyclase
MRDRFQRAIDYLRVSVTDRCNLRCRYCMPPEGVDLLPHETILSYEEIAEVVAAAAARGVTKVRLTGGEPLVRKGIDQLVRMVARIPGIRDLAMTTNGQLLAGMAPALAAAGLQRINISLDAMRPDRYRELTRGGDLRRVLEGIQAARAAGLAPIKLNCVVARSSDEPDARDVARFAAGLGIEARFIREMDLREGVFAVVDGGAGGDCARCNRLRLSSDGWLRPCLFSDIKFSVRELGAARALETAVQCKPAAGRTAAHHGMYTVGG